MALILNVIMHILQHTKPLIKWVYMRVKTQYAKNKITLFDIPVTGFKIIRTSHN